MPSLIVIGGAPGSGKTTVSRLLDETFQSVLIDYGYLREFHLDDLWQKESRAEEQMTFENLIFILKNYLRNGYRNIIVTDLQDFRLEQFAQIFAANDYLIVTLVLRDEDELRARVLEPTRDSGFRNVEKALAWNRAVIERPALRHEYKLDNTANDPEKTAREIISLINRIERNRAQLRMKADELIISTDKSRLQIETIQKFLAEDSYWAQTRTLEQTRKAIENSVCFGIYAGEKQIGFARVVSDYATFAYVGDVFILKEFRGQGLSKRLMETMLAHPDLQNLRRWILATRDAHGLYEQFGFHALKHPARWMELPAPDAY